MCGIFCSTLNYNNNILFKKLELIKHRGPNNKNFIKINDNLILGHTRLSILDLNDCGNQPFNYKDKFYITFNGEIYNYIELKKRFFNNYNFKTNTDTEIICAMYEKFGNDCINYFNGMFSFVIYDKEKNLLFCARDRLGKKPFYYMMNNNGIEIASTLNTICYKNNVSISDTGRLLYLILSYVPEPYTIYNEIKKLPPGHYLTYDLNTKKSDIKKYWDIFSNSCNFTIPNTYNEAKETLKSLLNDSISIRCRSDRPFGIFFSGGIDSSIIASILKSQNHNINGYTVQFTESQYNEFDYAKNVADYLNMPLKYIDYNYKNINQIVNDFTYFFDEPYADDSLIPTMLVSKYAKTDVDVVFCGDGGDELFFGYERYKNIFYNKNIPDTENQYKLFSPHWNISEVLNVDKYCALKYLDFYNNIFNKNRDILSYSDFDIIGYLNNLNIKTDRATMSVGLEARCPIMDYRIVEYSRLLPLNYIIGNDYCLKKILKDICNDYIPEYLTNRKKQGFTTPIYNFNNMFKIKEYIKKFIDNNYFNFILPEIKVDSLINIMNKNINEYNNNKILWGIYVYLKWFSRYYFE